MGPISDEFSEFIRAETQRRAAQERAATEIPGLAGPQQGPKAKTPEQIAEEEAIRRAQILQGEAGVVAAAAKRVQQDAILRKGLIPRTVGWLLEITKEHQSANGGGAYEYSWYDARAKILSPRGKLLVSEPASVKMSHANNPEKIRQSIRSSRVSYEVTRVTAIELTQYRKLLAKFVVDKGLRIGS